MTDLVLDPKESRVRIQTFAEGLLARLAHDLELECSDLSGTATHDGSTGTASLVAPLAAMTVAGVLGKDGIVDDHGLSPTERRDCIAKMQREVFHSGPDGVVRVEVRFEDSSARIRIVPPNGKTFETTIRPGVSTEGTAVHATGALEISLKAIGSDAVKGPMNAFRVKDTVKVTFAVVFVQPA